MTQPIYLLTTFRKLAFGLSCLAAMLPAGTSSAQEQISFSRQIRPILSKHCYSCHGPDEKERKADLRLDVANDNIDFEFLMEKVLSKDELEVMPPPHTNKPLSQQNIKLLEKWIEQGGQYEAHWAFVLPEKTSVPTNRHPIDFLVDLELAKHDMHRSDPAAPAILIRRLHLDLIGLPPTQEVAEEYIRNPTKEAFAKIVDDLLASPRYGERWARRWLDLARYADTNGFEKDRDRDIWQYRDWVIRSINEGKPFDQFTIEQLAGDMLPTPSHEQMVATGFHRNTMLNEEGGIDPLEYRYYALVDRVGTTGSTWLGLTTACAQCHTHKYDPITHENYFGLMAYFDNADEPDYFVPGENAKAKREENLRKASELKASLPTKWPKPSDEYQGPSFDQAFGNWLTEQERAIADWQVITPQSASSNLPHLAVQEDGTVIASGDITKHDTYTLSFPGHPEPTNAIRLEALPDTSLPGFGPGLTYYEGRKGDFFLAEIRIEVEDGRPLKWGEAYHTYAKNQFGNQGVSAKFACDGDFQTGWSVAGRFGERHVAVFNLAEPVPANTPFNVTMEFGRHFASSLGKFRMSTAGSDSPLNATLLNDDQIELLNQPNSSDQVELREAFAMQATQLTKHANQIRRLNRPMIGNPTMVMRERPANQKRETFLRNRGDYTQPRNVVKPQLPTAITVNQRNRVPTNRLEFARWLVSEENPLTARVVANRQWAAFFGTGLVATLDDFGMQGESPSHPELLDYLAVELMENAWSIKELHRLIVTSEAYQQSSAVDPTLPNSPSERLLQRFPRKRLEAEIIRDVSLFAAGILNEKMYGRPVRPPQPEGAAVNFSRSTWAPSPGEERFRRSIYTYQKRTAPFAMYTTFDAGSGESCLARRDVSNTPLQALTLMNDPMFVEISQAYGERMATIEGSVEEKIVNGFRWLLTRSPDDEELKMLTDFYHKHQSWDAVARTLLCLDETITKN